MKLKKLHSEGVSEGVSEGAALRDVCQASGVRVIDTTLPGHEPKVVILGSASLARKLIEVAPRRPGRKKGARIGTYRHRTEKQAIDTMLALRAEGMGYEAIAYRLNEAGLRTHRSCAWYPSTVRRIILRETEKK